LSPVAFSAVVVYQQVEGPWAAVEERLGGVCRLERDAESPGQVVAGAQRHQAQRFAGGELTPAAQGVDRRVHRPVPADQHDRTAVPPVQDAIQVPGLGALLDPHVRSGLEDRDRRGDPVVVRAARRGVGDHQQSPHVASLSQSDAVRP
jgi:hypothetical protein